MTFSISAGYQMPIPPPTPPQDNDNKNTHPNLTSVNVSDEHC